MSTPVRIAVIVVLGAVLAAIAVLFTISQVRQGEVLAGVRVDDVDLGGLGREDALAAVEDYARRRARETVTLTDEEGEFVVDPTEVGADLDARAVVDRALAAGREGSFLDARWAAITGTQAEITADVTLDPDLVTSRLEEIAAEVDRPPVDGEVTIDPGELEVRVVEPQPGRSVLVDEARDEVLAAYTARGADTLELPVETIPTRTDAADTRRAAETAAAAVAEDLVVASEDGEVTLAPRELAPMITSRVVGPDDDSRIELFVTPAAVEEHLVPVADDLLREPRDASFEAPRTPPVRFDDQDDAVWSPRSASITVIEGRNGTELDVELTAEELTEAVRNAERRVVLTLPEVPPAYTTQEAIDDDVDMLLSTFTTYHQCCQGRVANIQRLADLVDDTVVMPGEQFSINQISGNRTCDKGFTAAGMILDGEIVDVCGGGVSQFGTTTINAVFFAGLDPDAYKPHSFYISRYPQAREATLNYPSPDIDVRFTNDTGAPIIVRTTYSSTSITVSFYGSSDVTEVRADLGGTYDTRPFTTERRVNRSLPEGVSRTIQSGQNGFSVGLTRTVVRDGGSSTDDWTNTYVAKKQIIEYNPG